MLDITLKDAFDIFCNNEKTKTHLRPWLGGTEKVETISISTIISRWKSTDQYHATSLVGHKGQQAKSKKIKSIEAKA